MDRRWRAVTVVPRRLGLSGNDLLRLVGSDHRVEIGGLGFAIAVAARRPVAVVYRPAVGVGLIPDHFIARRHRIRRGLRRNGRITCGAVRIVLGTNRVGRGRIGIGVGVAPPPSRRLIMIDWTRLWMRVRRLLTRRIGRLGRNLLAVRRRLHPAEGVLAVADLLVGDLLIGHVLVDVLVGTRIHLELGVGHGGLEVTRLAIGRLWIGRLWVGRLGVTGLGITGLGITGLGITGLGITGLGITGLGITGLGITGLGITGLGITGLGVFRFGTGRLPRPGLRSPRRRRILRLLGQLSCTDPAT